MAKKTPENNAAAGNSKPGKAMQNDSRMQGELGKPEVSAASAPDNGKPQKKAAKTTKKDSDKPNIFKRMWKGIKGIISELKKVTWPKGKTVVKSTGVVLAVVIVFFVILFGIDYVLSGMLSLIVNGEWTSLFS